MRARRRWILLAAWGGFLGLLGLHLAPWPARDPSLHLGWIPTELLWRLAWMALATAYLFFFCTLVWRDDDARGSE